MVAVNENGRRIGEGHHNATITDETVAVIRELHEDRGWGYRRIAKHLSLRWQTVAKIARYQRRSAVPSSWRRPRRAAEGRATAGNNDPRPAGQG
jgi:ribosome-binding protein aMBF1 (putative translation factor)